MSKIKDMTQGNVRNIILKLTFPMVFGMLGILIFNLTDMYFIGQLGKTELAAVSFTFPVVLVINSISLGIGVGTASVVSMAIGKGGKYRVQRFATDSLLLAILIVIFFVITGLLTIKPIFRFMGADNNILPLINEYMKIWYIGMPFVVIPMVGNNIIRATGDTKTPSIVMMISAGLNIILDPILIFGIWIFPQMGIKGAALATVISRMVTFCVALVILIKREKLVIFQKVSFKEILNSWKKVLFIGGPNAGTRMIIPLASGIITGLLATQSNDAVAGYGVATRIEFFMLVIAKALAAVIVPFTGQNYGAKRGDRINQGIKFSSIFSLIYGVVIYIILFFLAPIIAKLFNKDGEVIETIVLYLRVVPITYGMQAIFLVSTGVLSALKKPIHSAVLAIIQMFVLYVPLAFIGSAIFGTVGIFSALALSYFFIGIVSYVVVREQNNLLNKEQIL